MGVSAVQRWDVGREGVTARVEVKLDVVTCSQSGEAVKFMQIRVHMACYLLLTTHYSLLPTFYFQLPAFYSLLIYTARQRHGKARGLLSIFDSFKCPLPQLAPFPTVKARSPRLSERHVLRKERQDRQATYDMEAKKYKQETAQTPILTWGKGGGGGGSG